MNKNTILTSEDGSHTILSSDFGVTYHSKHGALQETQTVFLDAGLHFALEQKELVNILEMGFGTGLNAIMTYQTMGDIVNKSVHYHTLEAYPIAMEMAQTLNYPSVLELTESQKEVFLQMHSADSDELITLNSNFSFTKSLDKLQNVDLESCKYDVIYYDAFAPNAQEELWTEEIMKKLYDATAEGGVLVTYCAKGAFKRALKSVGFSVEGLPGPKGKREMTRAKK